MIKKILKKKRIQIQVKRNFVLNNKNHNSRILYETKIMKINYAGEVSAQYLYYGQAYLIGEQYIKMFLMNSSKEEKKHLFWCIKYLNRNNVKRNNWYTVWKNGSFLIGSFPSLFSYKQNLGFLIETEVQVAEHIKSQLTSLSRSNYEYSFILNKMLHDEIKHANNALFIKSHKFPLIIKRLMSVLSFLMINISTL